MLKIGAGLPRVPKSENGGPTTSMSPLVVVIINKDEGFIRWHHVPAFSPAPKSGRNKNVFTRHFKVGLFRRI